jgi:Carboxypeptidase regulatory-like domain
LQLRKILSASLLLCGAAFAQDTTATIEGRVLDPSGGVIGGATIRATDPATGYTRSQTTSSAGTYHLSLPAAVYDLDLQAPNFGRLTHKDVQLSVSQTTRIDFSLALFRDKDVVTVNANAPLVQASSNEIGNVVTGRQLIDLPLNGRNFTQLGLLQPGVAPLTAGLASAGGSLRGGQAYAVNGQRPESNNYLLDGATNVNRVDGGYALRTPIDAIQEFRILTLNAPAEYGGTGGATMI